MKLAKFTVKRGDIDRLIHNLKALQKLCDNKATRDRYVALNLLESQHKPTLLNRILGRHKTTSMRVIVQIDRDNL